MMNPNVGRAIQAAGNGIGRGLAGDSNGGAYGGAYGGAKNAVQNATNQAVNATQKGAALFNPYIANGNQAAGGLQQMEGQFSDPVDAFNNWSKNYSMSPGAQFKLKNGLDAVQNQMAQEGLSGSGHEAEALTNYSQGVINEDMNHQWNNVLQGGRLGLAAGNELYGQGANAVRGAANVYGNEGRLYEQGGTNEAGLTEAEEQQRAQQKANNSAGEWGAAGAIGSVLPWSKWL